jgi:hypothetical protein
MAWLSLRLVIALIAIISVAIVAGVTLALALTSSFAALRDLGREHVQALADNAEAATTGLFYIGIEAGTQFANMSKTRDWPWPSESNLTMATFDALAVAATIKNAAVIPSLQVYFADNSRISTTMKIGAPYILHTQIFASNFTRDHPTLSQTLSVEFEAFSVDDFAPAPAAFISEESTGVTVNAARDSTLWPQFGLATSNGAVAIFNPPVATLGNNKAQLAIILATPLHLPNVPHTSANVFGYVTQSLRFDGLSRFLQRIRSTANSAGFIYDNQGLLLGTSTDTLFYEERPLSDKLPPGCASTAQYADAYETDDVHRLACRAHLTTFPHAALNAFASQYNDATTPAARTVGVADVDGDNVYYVSTPIVTSYRGYKMFLLLLLPEIDILGDVVKYRDTAIGITCALVAVAGLVNAAVVWLLLAPLGVVAQRMTKAADLEDDDDDGSVSAMSEVAELQNAYYAMNAELNRIRSYVPQSVLAARKQERGDNDEDDTTAVSRRTLRTDTEDQD